MSAIGCGHPDDGDDKSDHDSDFDFDCDVDGGVRIVRDCDSDRDG